MKLAFLISTLVVLVLVVVVVSGSHDHLNVRLDHIVKEPGKNKNNQDIVSSGYPVRAFLRFLLRNVFES
jgi:hypothetical protein